KDLSTDTTEHIRALAASSDGTSVWGFGGNGLVYFSHDGGSTWNTDENYLTDSFAAATCLNDCKQIVAVGANGAVAYRNNSDDNWNYFGKTRFDLRSITVLRDNSVLALGSDLSLFHPNRILGN